MPRTSKKVKKKEENKDNTKGPVYLSDIDIKNLEINNYKTKLIKAEKDLEQKSKQILELQKSILSLNAQLKDLDIYKSNKKTQDLDDKMKKQLQRNIRANDEIRNKHDLPEKWGFDPETGEVITE